MQNRLKSTFSQIKVINSLEKEISFLAISQLKSTIEIDKKIEAYLCIGMNPEHPPRASTSDRILEFEEELDTQLFDGCQKEFK